MYRDDPERADVVTLYLAGKGKGVFIDPLESYHKEIGAFQKWAKTNHLLSGRDNHVSTPTITFVLEVRADKVEYMEDDDDSLEGVIYRSHQPRQQKRTAAIMEGSDIMVAPPKPRRYVSSLPVPKVLATPAEEVFNNGAPPIMVYEYVGRLNENQDAIEWEAKDDFGYLWLSEKVLGEGQTKICYEVCFV